MTAKATGEIQALHSQNRADDSIGIRGILIKSGLGSAYANVSEQGQTMGGDFSYNRQKSPVHAGIEALLLLRVSHAENQALTSPPQPETIMELDNHRCIFGDFLQWRGNKNMSPRRVNWYINANYVPDLTRPGASSNNHRR